MKTIPHQDFASKAYLQNDYQGRSPERVSFCERYADCIVFWGIVVLSVVAIVAAVAL